MPRPIALCVEREGRFVSCVAVVGREPGLSLGDEGEVLWREERRAAIRLCVAQDGRLVLLREPGTPGVTLRRAGRRLEVPEEKPVFVMDQDEVAVDRVRLRLHVHGGTDHIAAPRPVDLHTLDGRPGAPRWLLAGAAALALGASAGFGGGEPTSEPQSRPATDAAASSADAGPASRPIEVREAPPVPPPPPPTGCGGCSRQPTAYAPSPRRHAGVRRK